MVSWDELAAAAPDLARRGRSRIEAAELILLGTIKADGSPRISPVEPDFVDGDLMLGMMWQSTKARDLLRDPRCVVNTTVADRHDLVGELKLIGNACSVDDPARRVRYQDTIEARLDWRPAEPFHIFAIDMDRAWWISYADERQHVERWP